MANGDFFSDVFGALTGQQVAPQQTIIPTGELFAQAGGLLPQIAGAENLYNQQLATGRLGVLSQFDPSLLPLQRAESAATLAQLGMGEGLSPELQSDIQRKLLETGTATGFGISPAGVGNVALETGLAAEARGIRRRAEARESAGRGLQLGGGLLPQRMPFGQDVGLTIAGRIEAEQSARDEMTNLVEDIRRQNFSNLLNTGGRILGGVAGGVIGAYTGNPVGGVMAGQAIGGSVFSGSRVAGRQQPQAGGGGGGGMFSQFAGMFGGGGGGSSIGGPQYGIGSQRQAGYEQGGVPMSSYDRSSAYQQGGVPMSSYG